MYISEAKRDLFNVPRQFIPAHCISADCKMGAGIALPMKKKFGLETLKDNVENWVLTPGYCVYYNGVYNLITKEKYWHKPTYDTMGSALLSMRFHVEQNGIDYIVMPKIGSGLDKLNWSKVREIIEEVFENQDVQILVCYL